MDMHFFSKYAFLFQRLAKYTEAKKKALKSRNDYVLCIEGMNAAMQKYFVDDIHDLIDVSKFLQ